MGWKHRNSSDSVPPNQKRAEIYRQLDEFRDPTRNVMSMEEWRMMGEMMGGVDAMGGPSTGLLRQAPAVPRPGGEGHQHHGGSPR